MVTKEETTDEGKTEEERIKEAQQEATLMLARAMHEAGIESELPRETMEALGTAVLDRVGWKKLPPKVKIAWMKLAIKLQAKLPRVEIPAEDRPKDPPSDKPKADPPPANGERKAED